MSRRGGCHTQSQVAVLVWVPLLLAFPLLNLAGGMVQAIGQVALVAATAAVAVAAVVGSSLEGRPRSASRLALAVLVVLVAVVATQGEGWQTGWNLLAIAAPAIVRGWWLALTLALATIGAAVSMVFFTDVDGDLYLLGVGGVLLAGLFATSFLRLLESNEQLQRTREELARAAVAEERARLSRDLHDLLGHTLSVMVVKAQAVRRLVEREPDAAAGHAADIEEVGRTALVDVRTAVDQMKAPSLGEELEGARSALDAAGIRTSVTRASEPVPSVADRALAWVVRESATNVLRHSGAASCRFEVTRRHGEIRLVVTDDGIGGPVAGGRVGGLDGLRQRLLAVDGRLDVRPDEDGFRLEASVPSA